MSHIVENVTYIVNRIFNEQTFKKEKFLMVFQKSLENDVYLRFTYRKRQSLY